MNLVKWLSWSFNLRREANPLATTLGINCPAGKTVFQSQARSQSAGDMIGDAECARIAGVSISGEKPIRWRRIKQIPMASWCWSFNLRREANPLATLSIRMDKKKSV